MGFLCFGIMVDLTGSKNNPNEVDVIVKLNKKMVYASFFYIILVMLTVPDTAFAMHIMEGFLQPSWCGLWLVLTIPFIAAGLIAMQKKVAGNPKMLMLLAFAGAFVFALSALKIPSVTGSCSHPTGVGLGAILFGPVVMAVLGTIVLIFQALLLAHGGITTLGANAFSMAVVGPFAAYAIYWVTRRTGLPLWFAVFLGAAMGDLMTYVTTSLQLALAFPDPTGGIIMSFSKFAGIFAVTQVPLAVTEGLLTVLVFNMIYNYSRDELTELALIKEVR